MTKSIFVSVLFSMFVATQAQATPGDTGCTAQVDGGTLELTIARDTYQEPVAYIDLSLAGKQIARFEKDEVQIGMVKAAVSQSAGVEDVLVNGYYSGVNENGFVYLRIPEQDPDASEQGLVLHSSIPAANFAASELDMKCQF